MTSRCCSLLVVFLLALPTPARAAPADEAEELARQGIQLFKDEQFKEALAVFERSLALHPIPVVAWNMARCHEELEQPEQAIRLFERFRELTPEPERRQIADTKIERLRQRYFGALTLATDPAGAEVLVGDKSLGHTPLQALPVRVGTHELSVRVPGHEPATRVVQIGPGQVLALELTLQIKPAVLIIDTPEAVSGLVVHVDGARLSLVAAPGRAPIKPGTRTVEINAGPVFHPTRQTITAGPGDEVTITLTRAAAALPSHASVVVVKKEPDVKPIVASARKGGRDYSTVASVILGLGLATAGAGGVLHVIAYAEWKDVSDAEQDKDGKVTGITRSEAVGIADGARWKTLAAYGLYGAGGAALVTSIVLYALSEDEPTAAFAPLPLPGGAGLSFSGRF